MSSQGERDFPARELKGKDFFPAPVVAPSAVRIDGSDYQDTSGFNTYAPLIEILQILWIFFKYILCFFVVFHGSVVVSVRELRVLPRR